MNNERDKINWIYIIIPVIGSVLAAFLGVGFGYLISTQPDFGISVQPITSPIPGPSEAKVVITIKDLHPIYKYKNQIILIDEIIGPEEVPSDIEISFDPIGFDPLITNEDSLMSNMTIKVGANVIPGKYKIKIIGVGGDGREKACVFILNVP